MNVATKMNLLTWNCQGAFRKKAHHLRPLQPTIAVIQECECPSKLRLPVDSLQPDDFLWQGDNLDKGVGFFGFGNVHFALDERYDPTFRHCIPVRVHGDVDLHILGIWAMGHRQKAHAYVGQVYYGVQHYAAFLGERDSVVLGDFNSNAIWDRERKVSNHSALVKALADLGLVSIYHEQFGDAQGSELQHTYYHHRSEQMGYHLDYCFVPQRWLSHLQDVTVGAYDPWCRTSDHTPLIAKFAR